MARAPGPPRPLLPLSLILAAAGGICLLVGWVEVSATTEVSRQVRWASLSVVGTVLVCVASGLWATSAERALLLRMHRLAATLPTGAAATVLDLRSQPDGAVLVATPAMARYHRPGCSLTAGKPVEPSSQAAHEQAGRQPCGMCAS